MGGEAQYVVPDDPIPNGLALVLGALVLVRGIYHLTYLGESEFAAATFSDGRVYFDAARNILAHPPWGTEPFYLQGLYAYFVALALGIFPTPATVMFLQLCVAGIGIALFFRAVALVEGRRVAGWATAALLAVPELAFYENKFLSAELGIFTNALTMWTAARYVVQPTAGRALGLGAAAGLAVLARGNLLLAVPFFVWSIVRRQSAARRLHVGCMVLGVVLALVPMMVRNAHVTGRPGFLPAHGGGTSFYIGNNPHSRGVWNTAGGLLTPDVTRERDALAETLGIDGPPDDRAERIGRELYRRAFEFAVDDPVGFAKLQLRKLYLLVGNDPLTQDYDWYGEQEMIGPILRFGLPFGVVLALGVVGAAALRRRAVAHPAVAAWGWVLLGQAVAVIVANIVFFTSSQHRVPLVLPLCAVAGRVVADLARRRLPDTGAKPWRVYGLAAVVLLQAFVPRLRDRRPSAVHYFNLAVVRVQLGLEKDALVAVERALERRPGHPLILLERARLLYRLRRFAEAEAAAHALAEDPGKPAFVRDQARRILRAIEIERRAALAP